MHVAMGTHIIAILKVLEQAALAEGVQALSDGVCILKISVTKPTHQMRVHIFGFEPACDDCIKTLN